MRSHRQRGFWRAPQGRTPHARLLNGPQVMHNPWAYCAFYSVGAVCIWLAVSADQVAVIYSHQTPVMASIVKRPTRIMEGYLLSLCDFKTRLEETDRPLTDRIDALLEVELVSSCVITTEPSPVLPTDND